MSLKAPKLLDKKLTPTQRIELPVLPDADSAITFDAYRVLTVVSRHGDNFQLDRDRLYKLTSLSHRKLQSAINFLVQHRYAARIRVRKNGRFHGSCYAFSFAGKVDPRPAIVHYSQGEDRKHYVGAKPRLARERMVRQEAFAMARREEPVVEAPDCSGVPEAVRAAVEADIAMLSSPEVRAVVQLTAAQQAEVQRSVIAAAGQYLPEEALDDTPTPMFEVVEDALVYLQLNLAYGLTKPAASGRVQYEQQVAPTKFFMRAINGDLPLHPAARLVSNSSDKWGGPLEELQRTTEPLSTASAREWIENTLIGRKIKACLRPSASLLTDEIVKIVRYLQNGWITAIEIDTLWAATRAWDCKLVTGTIMQRFKDIRTKLKEDPAFASDAVSDARRRMAGDPLAEICASDPDWEPHIGAVTNTSTAYAAYVLAPICDSDVEQKLSGLGYSAERLMDWADTTLCGSEWTTQLERRVWRMYSQKLITEPQYNACNNRMRTCDRLEQDARLELQYVILSNVYGRHENSHHSIAL